MVIAHKVALEALKPRGIIAPVEPERKEDPTTAVGTKDLKLNPCKTSSRMKLVEPRKRPRRL